MATYPENLNQDAGTIKTPAVYDSVLKQWLMFSQLVLKDSAGQPTKAQLDAFNRWAATVYAIDGGIDSLGARADAAQMDPTQAATAIAILKGLLQQSLGLGSEATMQDIEVALGILNGKDFATAAKQDAAKTVLDAISTAVAAGATEATLGLIKTALTDGTLKAQLSGSIVAPSTVDLSSEGLTLLASQATWTSPWRTYTEAPGIQAFGLELFSDVPLKVQWKTSDGVLSSGVTLFEACFSASDVAHVIPFRPVGTRGHWTIKNVGTAAATALRAREFRYNVTAPMIQNQLAVLAHAVEIRDTMNKAPNDSIGIFRYIRSVQGGGKVPIYINNSHNQTVTVSVVVAPRDTQKFGTGMAQVLGAIDVPAGQKRLITNQDFAGLDVPSEMLLVNLKCSVAPTTGSISIVVDNSVGGGV